MSVLLKRLVTRRFGFPAHVLAHRYGDKPFRAIVHGQSAACVVGEAPYSWAKIVLVILGVVALIAIVVAVLVVTR